MSAWLLSFLLALLPLCSLVALLLLGRYPGEAAIDRARRVIARLLSAFSTSRCSWTLVPATPGSVTWARQLARAPAGRGPPLRI